MAADAGRRAAPRERSCPSTVPPWRDASKRLSFESQPTQQAERATTGTAGSFAATITKWRMIPPPPHEEESTMPSDAERTYGKSTAWKPERPRIRLFPLVVAWFATGVALMVAAGSCRVSTSGASGAHCSSP